MTRKDEEKLMKDFAKDLKILYWTNLFWYKAKEILKAKSNHYVDIYLASIKYMDQCWFKRIPWKWFVLNN